MELIQIQPAKNSKAYRGMQRKRFYKVCGLILAALLVVMSAAQAHGQTSAGAKSAAKQSYKEDHSKGTEQEIRGMMSLNEISQKTSVPKAYFMKSLNLPAGIDAQKPVREWMHDQGKSVQDLRDAVKKYRSEKKK